MELNNKVNSVLTNVNVYFKMKKILIDADKSNICELAHKALASQGIVSTIELDENGTYVVKITKPSLKWDGEIK